MGLLDGLLGNASEISNEKANQEFQNLLIEGELIDKAFKILRDMIVFTNKRLILVDKQGLTGSKVEYKSIPYTSIKMFAKESAGTFDLDSELKLWIVGGGLVTKEFKKDSNVNEIYMLLSNYLLV